MKTWHLIVDEEPGKGSYNMAVDEFLFSSLTDVPETFVRFYQWRRPTASLGYTQKVENVIDLEYCRMNGIDVVRRITGGKLVLHHQEVTYSVCSSDVETFTPTLAGSYRLISSGLMRGLEMMGLKPSPAERAPAFYAKGNLPCFSHAARDEVELGGKKIIGSAQKRSGSKFLQHGSIPVAHDPNLLKAVSLLKAVDADVRMTSLNEALGRPVETGWAVGKLVAGLEEFFGVRFERLSFEPAETEKILSLQRDKYERDEWTIKKAAPEETGFGLTPRLKADHRTP